MVVARLSRNRHVRQGQRESAMTIVASVSDLRKCVRGANAYFRLLGKALQESLDHAVALELAALEKSAVPELHEIQERRVGGSKCDWSRIGAHGIASTLS